jgi:Kef-type K+ transport system membrane component KefB
MHSLLLLILQIAVILVVARGVGWLFRRLHQPQVVGEMAAGILLGPSLLGWVAPDTYAALFPKESLPNLNTLSQVGLLLFMFLVGLEFEPRLLRGRGHAAVVTSHVSIIVPFFLGSLLALFLYPRLSDSGVHFTGFALFMGAAMSVTAFPVLARILTERNLLQTRVGAVTIACAAVDDVTAWSILAIVVVIVRASAAETPLWLTLLGTAIYITAMLLVVRRALLPVEATYHNRGGRFSGDMIGGLLLLLLASAWVTEWLGIHALFGAFVAGAIMPKDPGFVHDLSGKLEDLTVIFLLPLFFAFTGLRTSIGLVEGAEMWFYAAAVLTVAVVGKFGGSTIAARITGLTWREASALGILMNTRGLMELVILTIGLELGVISPVLFAIMVLMALITTAMTTPVLEWLYPSRLIHQSLLAVEEERGEYTVLIPLSLPSAGPGLLEAALVVTPPERRLRVYAVHLIAAVGGPLRRTEPEEDVFGPLISHARHRGIEVRPLSFYSRDISKDILDVARVKRAELIVMGWHKPVVRSSILRGTVGELLREADADVGVFVERAPAPWHRVLVSRRDGATDPAVRAGQNLTLKRGTTVTWRDERPSAESRPGNGGDAPGRTSDGAVTAVASRTSSEVRTHEADGGYDLIVASLAPDLLDLDHFTLARAVAAHDIGGASVLLLRSRRSGSAPDREHPHSAAMVDHDSQT